MVEQELLDSKASALWTISGHLPKETTVLGRRRTTKPMRVLSSFSIQSPFTSRDRAVSGAALSWWSLARAMPQAKDGVLSSTCCPPAAAHLGRGTLMALALVQHLKNNTVTLQDGWPQNTRQDHSHGLGSGAPSTRNTWSVMPMEDSKGAGQKFPLYFSLDILKYFFHRHFSLTKTYSELDPGLAAWRVLSVCFLPLSWTMIVTRSEWAALETKSRSAVLSAASHH